MVTCPVCESPRVVEVPWRDLVAILRCLDCGAQCDAEEAVAWAIAEIEAEERALFTLDGMLAAQADVPDPVEAPAGARVAA